MRLLQTSRIAHVVLALLLLFPAIASAQSASPTPSVPYEQAKQTLDRLLTEAQRIQGQLDASQYDLDALSAKLGVNADDIVSYVRDNIAFEQYPGLLRGAKWTLIGRAGNSIDQAVLLATLLSKAGYQITIQHGKLNPQQASTLLAQMTVPRKDPGQIGNLAAIKTLLEQMARTAGVPADQIQPAIENLGKPIALPQDQLASVDSDAAAITKMLAAAGVQLGDSNALANLAAEASDYFWVSYRKTIDDNWTAAHPAFKTAGNAPNVTALESFDSVDAIPAADKQTISIQPVIERTIDGVVSQAPLGDPIQGAADQVAGQPIFFTTMSNAAAAADPANADVNDIFTKANLFAVQFNTHVIDNTTVVFDNHGSLFTLKQLKPGEFGIQPRPGEVIASSLGDAISAAFGDPTPTPGPAPDLQLTGLWLDITFAAPGGKAATVRRMILDRIGQANRDAGKTTIADPNDGPEVAAALAQQVSMFVSVGSLSVGYVTDQYFERLSVLSTYLRLKLRARYFPTEPVNITADQRDAVGTAWPGFNELMRAFDGIDTADPSVLTYRPAPAFVTYRQEMERSQSASDAWRVVVSVDVVANPRRAYSVANGSLALEPTAGVRAGVWETHSEAVPDTEGATAVNFDTMKVMAAAQASGIPIRVVRSAADLAGLELSPEAKKHLGDDLSAGYVAIVPAKLPAGQPLTGWWRVDPKSGETLGMLGNGRGAEMSETGLLIRAIACAGIAGFAGAGPVSFLIACASFVGGAAYGYTAGASPLVGEIIAGVGTALGFVAGAYGL